MAVLTMTAGLTNEFAFRFNRFADGFTISNLRFAYGAVYIEFATHTVDDDVQMKFAHTGNDGLVISGSVCTLKVGSSSASLWRGIAHLFLVSFGLRFNSNGNNGIREFHLFWR